MFTRVIRLKEQVFTPSFLGAHLLSFDMITLTEALLAFEATSRQISSNIYHVRFGLISVDGTSLRAGLYAGPNYCQSHMFWWTRGC